MSNLPGETLLEFASRVLGDESAAKRFMETPHMELDGKTPAESDEDKVRKILTAIEWGLPA